jgi:hypothetical protein
MAYYDLSPLLALPGVIRDWRKLLIEEPRERERLERFQDNRSQYARLSSRSPEDQIVKAGPNAGRPVAEVWRESFTNPEFQGGAAYQDALAEFARQENLRDVVTETNRGLQNFEGDPTIDDVVRLFGERARWYNVNPEDYASTLEKFRSMGEPGQLQANLAGQLHALDAVQNEAAQENPDYVNLLRNVMGGIDDPRAAAGGMQTAQRVAPEMRRPYGQVASDRGVDFYGESPTFNVGKSENVTSVDRRQKPTTAKDRAELVTKFKSSLDAGTKMMYDTLYGYAGQIGLPLDKLDAMLEETGGTYNPGKLRNLIAGYARDANKFFEAGDKEKAAIYRQAGGMLEKTDRALSRMTDLIVSGVPYTQAVQVAFGQEFGQQQTRPTPAQGGGSSEGIQPGESVDAYLERLFNMGDMGA